MKFNIRNKILLSTAVTMFLVIILGLILFNSMQNLNDTAGWVKHTHNVISNASTIEKLVVDMETGERGFLIAGKEEFLEPYDAGKRELIKLLKETKKLVSDNLPQVEKLNEIEDLINSWQEKAGIPEIEKRREVEKGAKAFAEFERLQGRTVGKDIFDTIRNEFKMIETEFNRAKSLRGKILLLETFQSLLDMETGQRGFLLTGQEESLEPFNKGQVIFNQKIDDLKSLIRRSSTSSILQSVNRIVFLENQWEEKAALPEIDSRRLMNEQPATMKDVTALIEGAAGKNIMDSIRVQLREFIEVEEDLMNSREMESADEQTRSEVLVLVGVLAILLISISWALWLANNIATPLLQVIKNLDEISQGNIRDEMIKLDREDEVGTLGKIFNKTTVHLKAIVNQAETIADGNFEKDFVPQGEKDTMGYSLQKMTKTLRDADNENKRKDWLKTGLNKINEQIRDVSNIEALAQNIITFLANYLEAQIGALYVAEEEGKNLKLAGRYAFPEGENSKTLIQIGEGLVGQAAYEKEIISVTHIPEDYSRVSSAIGDARPRNVVISPFVLEDRLIGVIELGSLKEFSEDEMEFLESSMKSIAVSFFSIESNEKQRILLEETQLQSKELKSQQEKLQKANDYKSEFLANMSHEIRTPMNAIVGMSHLAMKTDLSPKQENYVSKIQSAANALLGIINDILDFSKIEAGKLSMEAIDFQLDEVLDNLSTLVTLKAQEKGLEVLFSVAKEVPYSLVGDALRLGQVLTNLTNNAIKFTEQGEIIIEIKCVKEEKEQVELEFLVKDTGIGLTEAQIGKLFQSFSQADTSTTRQFGGTGLGLTISKKLVEMMNGKIWIESEPGKGSSFIFTVVLGVNADQKKKRIMLSDDLKGKRVLIVDDNESAREILDGALQSFSMDVSMASSGSESISMVESADANQPYDLIIMDWQMPEMNGIRAAEIIKKHPKLKKIPKIIMLTAYGREEVMRQAEEAKLDGFLVKPMNPSLLFISLMETFGGKVVKEKFGKSAQAQQKILGLENIRGSNILVVEDNDINQEIAIELLEQAGFCVTVANNGKEGVEKVTQSEFDCVLMDCQMPVMDGYEASRTIRKDNRFSSLPIIAMTANAMLGDREKCIDAGMNDHVAKPINPNDLFSALIKWIQPKEEMLKKDMRSSPKKGQTKKDESTLPDISGIDMATGIARVMGNEKLYRKLLGNFYQDNINIRLEIEKALDLGDIKLAERLVHTVRGVSASIGANELAEVAKPLEAKLNKRSKKINKKLWDEFWNCLELVLEGLRPLAPKDNDKKEKLDYSKIKVPQPIIDVMKKNIEVGSYLDLEQNFLELGKLEPFGKNLTAHLKEMVSRYDDDGILAVLNEIEKNS